VIARPVQTIKLENGETQKLEDRATLDIIGNKNLSCNQVYQRFGAADEKLLADCANHTLFPSPNLKSYLLLVSMAL